MTIQLTPSAPVIEATVHEAEGLPMVASLRLYLSRNHDGHEVTLVVDTGRGPPTFTTVPVTRGKP